MKKRSLSPKKGKVRQNKLKRKKFLLFGFVSLFILSLSIAGLSIVGPITGTSNSNNNPLNHTNTPNSYTVTVIDNSTGGNLTHNTAFMQYIPKTELNDKIIVAAQKGTPMVTFGDGSPPHVMITAGVHGAELPSQIAAMKLINDLTTTKIKGTVYIIPVVAPFELQQTQDFTVVKT